MEFFHKRAMLFLRLSFGLFFTWFGLLLLFNVNPIQATFNINSNPLLHSQLFIFSLSIVEIVIGIMFLANKFLKLATTVMIFHELLGALYLFLTIGFEPRFPLLSIFGILALKDLILISGGLVILAEHNEIKEDLKTGNAKNK